MTESFRIMYNDFESTKDISGFTEKYGENRRGIRFLLLRSLDSTNLIEIMTQFNIQPEKGKFEHLLAQAYASDININDIVGYIDSKRSDIDKQRTAAEDGLREIIKGYGAVNCGLRNDKVDDIVKALVRDKTIKTVDILHTRIENEIVPRIQNYILWSFYNQTTNDIIEHCFINHPKVLPTLRKIHDIDFFILTNDEIIPFDLKITHIAEDFFDLYSKGLVRASEDQADSFIVDNNNKSEIEKIKEYYKNRKKDLALPNYGGLSKNEILEILLNSNDHEAASFVADMFTTRAVNLEAISSELDKLEWWNYKYQGERLFSNNNRLFVFLAYTNVFEDGRPIKGELDYIGDSVASLLDSICNEKINNIRYHYDKERSLAGDYSVKSISLLIKKAK